MTRDPRFPLFDSMRAIAALSVVAFHLAFFTGHLGSDGAGRWLSQLNVGVTIFFLVSAFLLYRPFARARLAGDPVPALVPYAVRRALRIVPAYWVTVLVGGAVLGIAVADSPRELLSYLTFTQVYSDGTLFGGNGLGHAWTLCVEVTFYAMLPVWAWAMRRVSFESRRGFVITELAGLAVLVVVALLWLAFVVDYANGFTLASPAGSTLPPYLDHFAFGMALAVTSVALADGAAAPAVVRSVERRPWWPWAVAFLAFALLGAIATRAGVGTELVRHELKALVAVGILLPAVFGRPGEGWVRVLLARPELMWVGLVSYGLYLWHPPIMHELLDAGMSGVPYAIVSIALSLAVAAASWYLVERWALRLGRRLLHRPPSEPERAAAFAEPAP